ncbi:hypothetical protein CVT26_009682 [Gymnopilus dilepis]|uniref:Transposase domain-containing protein n=1 Tax=Gymnopilus dilepis TaxID=231916 RepID=A0A409YBV0_9AGAR|nr:hypothetical protein CVT26_009682 [Gymnopilus dilepis]
MSVDPVLDPPFVPEPMLADENQPGDPECEFGRGIGLQARWQPPRVDADSEEETCSENDSDSGSEGEEEGDANSSASEDDDFASMEDEIEAQWEKEWTELANDLSDEDLRYLRAFSFKVDENLADKTFERMRHFFPELNFESLKTTKSRVEFLAAFRPALYDCCVNSCLCYLGSHKDERACHYCKEPRFNADGRPRKRYLYIPLIPRLLGYYKNIPLIKKMSYRHNFQHDPNITKDVFDSSNYQKLRATHVSIGGEKHRHQFFDSKRDIALGLSTDGFAPFKKRKQTCWPLLLFNYNLPPEIRFWIEYIICIGVIPGPKKPKDFDSFLAPLVDELLELLTGVRAYDALAEEMFMFRAYLILVFGDMPAMSMVMRMKGHNGICPCRMCLIKGVRIPGARGNTHYVPLDRSQHPDVQDDPLAIQVYDPASLPLRSHEQFMEHARQVQFAPTAVEEERLAKSTGVKGIPLLSHLPSLFFPKSCPHDFMHMMFENNLPNLILLWTGKFKGLDEGTGDYHLATHVWEAIGEATAASGATIPSAYGARPQDVAQDKTHCTADSWSFWASYLGPVLLRGRFSSRKYYTHFIELVKLINLCLQFEITKEEIEDIRVGFQDWVQEYERLYYQLAPERLSACPVTVHALLHIADSIEECGPVWAYWAFPMERFCGILQPCIKSRRFPFANLDNHVKAVAQLSHIKTRYNLHDKLSTKRVRDGDEVLEGFSVPTYPATVLLHPRKKNATLDRSLKDKVVANIELWGRIRHTDGGDTINASSLVKRPQEDSRDASYVRYELLVDQNARRRNLPPNFIPKTFYGQLQHLILVQMPATEELGLTESQTLILGSIRTCTIEAQNDLDMHYYKDHGRTEVVDVSTIQCLVGRVKDRSFWVIIDRSGKLARPEFRVE